MPRLRYSVLLAFVVLTLVLLFLRIETVGELRAKVVGHGSGSSKTTGGGKSDAKYPPVSSLLIDHGTPPVPFTAASLTVSYPSIVTSGAVITTTTDSAGLASTIIANDSAPQTRPASSPTPGKSTTSNALSQEEFEKERNAITSNITIFGHTLNDLERTYPDSLRHPEALRQTNDIISYNDTYPLIYNPYLDSASTSWRSKEEGSFVQCKNPWNNTNTGELKVFIGHLKGFPEPSFGSYDVLDIDSHLCFERWTRLEQYGYRKSVAIDWDSVDWGHLQQECADKNANRYNATTDGKQPKTTDTLTPRQPITRTAVILRAPAKKQYTNYEIINMRSLINELALGSGGEYQVFLLIEVKGIADIWTDKEQYRQTITTLVPKEFKGITELWSEKVVQDLYPNIPKNLTNVRQSHWLAIQRFSHLHPEFEHYWSWEMDSRYTGHYYDLFEKLAHFAKSQPRKGLWERNERYYIPGLHGAYNGSFREMVGYMSWQAPEVDGIRPVGPKPPAIKDDDYSWGVGEEADYISLGPIFNPIGTAWADQEQVWGYGDIPRRATVLTQSRCSKHLLDTMHAENLRGNHMSSEMAPQTVALLHGLKAVYAPHPVFFDRVWGPKSLEKWFNPGPYGDSGGDIGSPFGQGREVQFKGSTWYHMAEAATKLYSNWLGMGDSVDGGDGIGGPEWEKKRGRMCLPPMLLHPVR